MTTPPTPRTTLVIPAYNAGEEVRRTWNAVVEFLHPRRAVWDVLFVCDGCTDGTEARLNELADALPSSLPVRVAGYEKNRGKGYAVRHGFAEATGQVVLFADADLAYGFADIERVAAAVWDGAAVAIGSRAHPDSRITIAAPAMSYVCRRHLQSRVFSRLARWGLGLPHQDTQAGVKGFTRPVIDHLFPHLTCDGFLFDCDILAGCRALGIPVTEVAVNVQYDTSTSTVGMGKTARALGELWRIRRSWKGKKPSGEWTAPAADARPAAHAA